MQRTRNNIFIERLFIVRCTVHAIRTKYTRIYYMRTFYCSVRTAENNIGFWALRSARRDKSSEKMMKDIGEWKRKDGKKKFTTG